MNFHVLVIGSGAREHAIADTLLRGMSVERVSVAPGNPGMLRDGIQIIDINVNDTKSIINYCHNEHVDFVFVGPEVPLIHGIVDDLRDQGILAFGPTKQAAQIEGSKDFAKRLMSRYHIPTASYRTFNALEPAVEYVQDHGAPIVIKADGLAAGKGVTVAMDDQTALHALHEIFVDHRFGDSGAKVVIEDFLEGQEFSLMSFVDGQRFWVMPISQDHKRAYDGDKGPNTGGMGAYSPVPQISDTIVQQAIDTIVRPTVEAMAAEGIAFTGVLYAGLIATATGPQVIEFNARFGDPETEVILPRLTSDLGAAIWAILHHEEPSFIWKSEGVTLGVVIASEGYPAALLTGSPIPSVTVNSTANEHIYYAGVALQQHKQSQPEHDDTMLVSDSGRVMLVQVEGETMLHAQQRVYQILDNYTWEHLYYRHDIGHLACER